MEFDFREKMINDLFISIEETVGIQVCVIIIEMALWKTEIKHKEANLIWVFGNGVKLEELFKIEPDRAIHVFAEFLNSVIVLLTPLIGSQAVNQLTKGLGNIIIQEIEMN